MESRVIVIGADEMVSEGLVSLLEENGIESAILGRRNLSFDVLRDILPSAVIVHEESVFEGWKISFQIRNYSDVPIVILGTDDSERAWVKAAAYGVDCYMARPFSPLELVARIRALVRRYEHNHNRVFVSAVGHEFSS